MVSFWCGASVAELKMPTDTESGSLNVSLPASADIRSATVNISQFVKNPAVAKDYVFTANGLNSNTVEIYKPEFKFEFIEPAANVTVNMTVNVTVNVTIPNGTKNSDEYNLTALGLEDKVNVVWLNWTDGYNFTEAIVPMVDNLTWSLNVNWTTAGTYEFVVYVNDVWDNTGVSPTGIVNVTPVVVVEKPDLIVEVITPNCGEIFANETNNISAKIKNNGTADAGAFNVSFVSGEYSEIVEVPTLAAGANTTVTITDPTIRTLGDSVTITVTADCYGEVSESNETNNASALTASVMNNGYKDKRYTGGEDIKTVQTD